MQQLSIRLLGPVEARRDGERLDLGGPLPRGALAALALSVATPVPADALVDALWGDSAPAAARSSLAAHLSRLRRRGLEGVLVHRDGGYALDVEPMQVDLHLAEALHAQGRAQLLTDPPTARSALTDARRLWRGDPLSGLGSLPFVDRARARCLHRLEEIERDLVDVLLALGEGAQIVAELEAAARQQPLNERVWCQLLQALYTSGRRVEALAAYRTLAAALRRELGLDPSARTEEVHRAILRGDRQVTPEPTADVARPPPRPARPSPPFIGRHAELDQLGRAAEGAAVITLVGVSGIGKTRLIREHVARAGAADVEGPWLCDLSTVDDPDLVAASVARAMGMEAVGDAAMIEAMMIEALAARRCWLVLDSCESVTPAVGALVESLVAGSPGLTVFATSLTPLDVPGEVVLPIGPLDTDGEDNEAMALFDAVAGRRSPQVRLQPGGRQTVNAIVSDLEGIPLAIELTAAHADHLPLAEIAAITHDRRSVLPSRGAVASRHQTLNEAIRWSVESVPPDGQQALSAAAVFTGGFTAGALVGVLRAYLGRPPHP